MLEPRELNGHVSCAVCREIDRLRGICTLIPAAQHIRVVTELRLLSGRLREWQVNRFRGPPADYVDPPEPEVSLAQSLRPTSSRPPEPRGPPPSHLRVASESHIAEPCETSVEAASSKKKRKKKNKGQGRVLWQRACETLDRARRDPLDQSGSELSDKSDLD